MSNIDYSSPFRAYIRKDCRDENGFGSQGDLTGRYGVCLGYYKYPHVSEETYTGDEDGNPLLQIGGDYILGGECFWEPAPEGHKPYRWEDEMGGLTKVIEDALEEKSRSRDKLN